MSDLLVVLFFPCVLAVALSIGKQGRDLRESKMVYGDKDKEHPYIGMLFIFTVAAYLSSCI